MRRAVVLAHGYLRAVIGGEAWIAHARAVHAAAAAHAFIVPAVARALELFIACHPRPARRAEASGLPAHAIAIARCAVRIRRTRQRSLATVARCTLVAEAQPIDTDPAKRAWACRAWARNKLGAVGASVPRITRTLTIDALPTTRTIRSADRADLAVWPVKPWVTNTIAT